MSAHKSPCACRSEGGGHKGRTRRVRVDVNAQPPGLGSFTVSAVLMLCEEHAEVFEKSHLNAWTA